MNNLNLNIFLRLETVALINVMPLLQQSNFYLSFLSQLFHDPDGSGIRKKARKYINDVWNILDVLSIILFIIGLAFRYVFFLPDSHCYHRVAYESPDFCISG